MNTIQPYDIGCEPSPSVPAETLIQDGWRAYLLFHAVSKKVNEKGFLDNLGVAVVECINCSMTKFGYPNDEGLPEHPLYHCGLENCETSIVRVADSVWVNELEEQKASSATRIWGGRGFESHIQPKPNKSHFLIMLKELTFECIADDIKAVEYFDNFDEAIKYAHDELDEN